MIRQKQTLPPPPSTHYRPYLRNPKRLRYCTARLCKYPLFPPTHFCIHHVLRDIRLSNLLLLKSVFSVSLFSLLLSVLLFARTPDSPISRTSSPTNPTLSRAERYGRYENAPSDSILSAKPHTLSYNHQNFTLDGRPIRLISGSVHYFRMPPSRWRAMLQYAKLMGLNAIETYMPWNLHEPSPGVFRFSGMLDVRAFLETAQQLGLLVLLRPGPYICSEWDLGGLPPHLLADKNMRLRSSYRPFMKATQRYFAEVGKQIRPYIGRPIVAIQVENEYGAYGYEKRYLHAILRAWENMGFTGDRVMFFTSDNGGTKTVLNGSQFDSQKVLKTVNLESKAHERIKMLRWMQPNAPAMIAEFWTGWFDHWGEIHHTRNGESVRDEVAKILNEFDASINLYMFFGGTNFGFMSGANIDDEGVYWADVTSYDYDAFVTEYGGIRKDKYIPMKAVIHKFWTQMGNQRMLDSMSGNIPNPPRLSGYAGRVTLNESIPLFDVLDIVADKTVVSKWPLTMEAVGGDYGFILYRHNLTHVRQSKSDSSLLRISGVRDFAYILLDGKVVNAVDRNREVERNGRLKTTAIPPGTARLDIIVENRGRVNYGQYIHDRKGIVGNVTINSKSVEWFECITMSFPQDHTLLRDVFGRETLSIVKTMMAGRSDHDSMNDPMSPPTFFRGEMTINPGSLAAFKGELPGTHCRLYGRGVLWVNGFNVGRFHTGVSGPQRAVFVPGALLKEGRNEFLVLHMNMHLAREPPNIQLFEDPQLGTAKR